MASLDTGSILKVALTQESDILRARQRAKQVAAQLGFAVQDQTRIATAVSEIARNAFEYAQGGSVDFSLQPGLSARQPGVRFTITVTDHGSGIAHVDSIWNGTYRSPTGMGLGLAGARRLMDDLQLSTGPTGTTVVLSRQLPPGLEPPSAAEVANALSRTPTTQTDALTDQNQELLRLLNENRMRESELRTLNQELEETNRGVLVLYAELEDKAHAVQEASALKQRFLSGVTHELRTPLNSIVSLTRLMLSHVDGPLNTEQQKQAQFILRSAQNLSEMVNDLLDLARVEAGKASTTLTTFTVAELYAGLRGMFRPLATNPDVRLLFDIPEKTLTLHTDEGKLAQILRNFITNALKFTAQGSVTVSVELSPAAPTQDGQQFITFAVADTGQGIAPEHHELVMQEWGQAPNELAPGTGAGLKIKGSGLGLPLSRAFADLLGGKVHFVSAPAVGSTFRVTLPALVPDAAAPAAPPVQEASAYILVADDDEVARYLLRRQLAAHTTAEILEVSSGQQALEAIAARVPALVFVDQLMPGLSGMDVIHHLRADPRTATLPIVLHTAHAQPADIQADLQALEVSLIQKQFTPGANPKVRSPRDAEEQSAAVERVLLQVGLSNMHQAKQDGDTP